jgi:hypothetical protein
MDGGPREIDRSVTVGSRFRGNDGTQEGGAVGVATPAYSTVTDLARLRGWSTSVPFATAT